MVEFWVPIMGMITFFGTIIVFVYLHYRNKGKKLETIVKLAESGGEVKPEMLELLGREGGPTGDLRKGLIWLAIGVPLALGLMVEGEMAAAAFSLVPMLIGVSYLVVMKIGYKDSGKSA